MRGEDREMGGTGIGGVGRGLLVKNGQAVGLDGGEKSEFGKGVYPKNRGKRG